MQNRTAPRWFDDYAVAIICAIEFEMSAVRYMLDREHPRLPSVQGDANDYILGELSGHNVVLTWLPGVQGKSAAAIVATNLHRTFPSIEWRFLVGIGGGVPGGMNDIRLGDVVVSMPKKGQHSGVIQYDLGKDTDAGFKLKGFLLPPQPELRVAMDRMQSDHKFQGNRIAEFVSALLDRNIRLGVYRRPSQETDILFDSDYAHIAGQDTCKECDRARISKRLPRADTDSGSKIHYGLIASGDRVMRSSIQRGLHLKNFGDILCFEMEAAGLMTEYPTAVIRGISDYADSHKNDDWQLHAAAAAAACTKELLTYLQAGKPPRNAPIEPQYPPDNRFGSGFQSTFTGRGVHHSGDGNFSVGGNLHIS